MVNDGVVRSIVETYELPGKLEEKMIWIATQRLNEMYMNQFDEIYTYIAGLIDKFRTPYSHRSMESLDAERSWSDSRSLYETSGSSNPNLEELTKDEEQEGDPVEPEALQILERELPIPQYDFALGLIQKAKGKYRIRTSRIKGNMEQIKARLGELAERFQRNGKILMPRGAIKGISFDPLSVTFKPRRYNRNPIDFFEENGDFYQRMTRSELYEVDRNLYSALRRAGQLRVAIPDAQTGRQT